MTEKATYKDVFKNEPAPFYPIELTAKKFGGIIRVPNKAIMNDSWYLRPVSESDQNHIDPLLGLHRMGLLNLVNHRLDEEVILVLPVKDNITLVDEKFGVCYQQEMICDGDNVRVITKAKVDRIEADAVKTEKLIERKMMHFYWGDHGVPINLDLFRRGKIKIRKRMEGKISEVATHLSKLRGSKVDDKKRGVYNWLLQESLGDPILAMAICKVYYQKVWKMSQDNL